MEQVRYSHERWTGLVAKTFAIVEKLGTLKGGEYSGDDDRLANFRRNAAALGLSKESVWAVYSAKHWDALMQFIKDLNDGKTRPRLESLSGRCDDLIVYLILFKAMLEESDDKLFERKTITTSSGGEIIVGTGMVPGLGDRLVPRTFDENGRPT